MGVVYSHEQGRISAIMGSDKKSYDNQDTELLKVALDHVVGWNEFQVTCGLQVVSFFLLSAAVLAAAYVSALTGHLYAVAGTIALVGAAASGGAYLIGRRQSYIARLAQKPLMEIQDRLAGSLNIDSLRMAVQVEASRRTFWRGSNSTANVIFPVAMALSMVATIYAWLKG